MKQSILLILIIFSLFTTTYQVKGKVWTVFDAARNNQIEILKELIADGEDIEPYIGNRKETPLMRAAFLGHTEIVRILIKAGADPLVRDKSGNTAFHYAAGRGYRNTAELLLSNGAKFDQKNNSKSTPFFSATYNSKEETALWLLELGADPNIKPSDSSSSTPIFYAASNWQPKLVKALIEKGINVNVTEDMGATPLHIASSHGSTGIVSMLINAGADVNALNDHGWTPLYYATSEISLIVGGDTATVIDLLVKNGADITIPDGYDQTPLDIAEQTMAKALRNKYPDEETKEKRIKNATATLKRVKYHTKRSNRFWNRKKHKKSATKSPFEIQKETIAKNNAATASASLGSKNNMPLKIVLLIAGMLVIVGVSIYIFRTRKKQ